MAELKTLEDALIDELEDILDSETRITEALPKMAQKATHPELKAAFEEHLEQTKVHIQRLNQAFELLGKKPAAKTCEATKGLIKEGEDVMSEDATPDVMDAFLIAAAQKVEHYEIASYGTVCTWAEITGHEDVADLLGETLDEEEDTNDRLTDLAESSINEDAL